MCKTAAPLIRDHRIPSMHRKIIACLLAAARKRTSPTATAPRRMHRQLHETALADDTRPTLEAAITTSRCE
jgi:hypothetical protein